MSRRGTSWLVVSSFVWATGCGGEEFTSADPDASAGSSTGGSSSDSVATTGTTTGIAGSAQTTTSGTGGSVVSTGAGGASGMGGRATGGSGGNGGSSTGAGGTGGRLDGGQGGGAGSVDAGKDAGGGCPAAQPLSGSACSPEGIACRYGDCCPVTATCSGGKWQVVVPPCAPPICPAQAPANGSSCACLGALSCHYDTCSQTQLETDAKCLNNAWSVQTYGCENACGVEDCMAGQICFVKSGTMHCVANPCLPQPLSCGCATSLCPANNCTVMSATLTCQ
jgi:hypothetical protein